MTSDGVIRKVQSCATGREVVFVVQPAKDQIGTHDV